MVQPESVDLKAEESFCQSIRRVVLSECNGGYSATSPALKVAANAFRENTKHVEADQMELIADACSMMFAPKSINKPFRPVF